MVRERMCRKKNLDHEKLQVMTLAARSIINQMQRMPDPSNWRSDLLAQRPLGSLPAKFGKQTNMLTIYDCLEGLHPDDKAEVIAYVADALEANENIFSRIQPLGSFAT